MDKTVKKGPTQPRGIPNPIQTTIKCKGSAPQLKDKADTSKTSESIGWCLVSFVARWSGEASFIVLGFRVSSSDTDNEFSTVWWILFKAVHGVGSRKGLRWVISVKESEREVLSSFRSCYQSKRSGWTSFIYFYKNIFFLYVKYCVSFSYITKDKHGYFS